jgi:lysyl-tRNA synthetase class 2
MENDLVQARRNKLQAIKDSGSVPFPNGFTPNITISGFTSLFQKMSREELEALEKDPEENIIYQVAGRIHLHRVMGKTSFAHIGDHSGRLQLYLKENLGDDTHHTPSNEYQAFKKYDLGDIVGVCGYPYRTQKGELSLRVTKIELLTKSLLPFPDKHAGLEDLETRYRQRYLDLISNSESMKIFQNRSHIIQAIRIFMVQKNFLEVETPMLHPIPGGANARPFITHHNTLDIDLYLRIAPELYLKRLIVGGLTRVFEINRNFRNEGMSPRHNPEFTMMEFYQAYATHNDLMLLIENLFSSLQVHLVLVGIDITKYRGCQFKLPFPRISMGSAVQQAVPSLDIHNPTALHNYAIRYKSYHESLSHGELLSLIFEEEVEHTLIDPTFITDFPIEISPLARRSDTRPDVAERFELYMNGQELANGFSELNDPDDQADRFRKQVESRQLTGNEEAMFFDEDYITALRYGMPPTAGAGIGIDRLVAILLDQLSIKDVILFPTQRPR